MRFVTFQRHAYTEAGVLLGEEIIGLRGAGFDDLMPIVGGGPDAIERVSEWLRHAPGGETVRAADVKLRAPILRPPKIICVGLNYRDHAAESNQPIPDVPTIFAKFANTVIGPGESIVLPKVSCCPDYEAELALVIGRGGRNIPEEKWSEHVFGYMCCNDVSARDFQMATTQWVLGKSFDTFAPMGPALVTKDEIPDPHALGISLSIAGEVLQNSNTKHLVFRIPYLISHLSSVMTLEPGDVISTGTPAGVGVARRPARFLRPGDEVTVKISGLGELRNGVVAEA